MKKYEYVESSKERPHSSLDGRAPYEAYYNLHRIPVAKGGMMTDGVHFN